MNEPLRVFAVSRDGEQFVWIYSVDNRVAALRSMGMMAANPSVCFNWYDAAVCANKVRQEQADETQA